MTALYSNISVAFGQQYEAAERIALKIRYQPEREQVLALTCERASENNHPEIIYRIALHIESYLNRDYCLAGSIRKFREAGNFLAAARSASAIIEEEERIRLLRYAALDLLGDDNPINSKKEEVVDQMLKIGAPPQELLDWGESILTPNIIRRVVYENLVPDSVIREKVKSLRAHRQDALANMIHTEFARTLPIREEAFKEYSTRLGAAAFTGIEEVLPITPLRNLIGTYAFNYTELSEKQRQEFAALCLARDPRKT